MVGVSIYLDVTKQQKQLCYLPRVRRLRSPRCCDVSHVTYQQKIGNRCKQDERIRVSTLSELLPYVIRQRLTT